MIKLDYGIIFNVINIIVLFLFLKMFLFKPVNAMFAKRADMIASNIKDAESKKAEAYQLKSNYEDELKHAGEQASVIIKEARERAELEFNRKLEEAREEAGRVMDEAQKVIEYEKRKSLESAQSEIAGLALLAAAKVIGKNVDDDTNKQYLGDFLKEVGASK